MAINSKKLMQALTQRGAGAVVGGAIYGFVEPYVPVDNNYLRLGLLAAAGALVPEMSPKSKMLDYAGAGICACAGADLVKIVMNSDRADDTKKDGVAGLGVIDPIYAIDEDGLAGLEKQESSLA